MSVTCPYCGEQAPLTHSREVYGRDYGWLYMCKPCNAYVGCHKGTTKSKGSPANHSLREARKSTHRAFDPIWRETLVDRRSAYKWLAEQLGIDGKDCHIGMFNLVQCELAINACHERPIE